MAVSAIFTVHGAVAGTFASRVPAIQEHLHLGTGAMGIALLMVSIGSLAAMPFTGVLINRFGGRATTHVLLGAYCAVLALPAYAPSLPVLCAVTLLSGAAGSTADVAMNAEGVLLQQRIGTSIISGLHGLWSLGGFAAGGIGALVAYAGIGVRAHFVAAALVLLVAGQAACRGLPAAPAVPPGARDAGSGEPGPRFALATGAVLAIALVGFCAVFVEIAGSDWSAIYMRRVLGAGSATAAMSYAIFAGTMAATRLSGDRVVRRFGSVRVVRLAGAAGTAGSVLVVLAPASVPTVLGFALMGLGIAIVVPLAFAAAGAIGGAAGGGSQTGHAIAGVATVAYGGGLAAPSIIGAIGSTTSLRTSFVLVCVLAAAVVLGASALRTRATAPAAGEAPVASEAAHTRG